MPLNVNSLNLFIFLVSPFLPKIKFIKTFKGKEKDNKKEPNLMAIYARSISLMRDVLLIVAKERHHFPTDLSF